MTNRQSKLFINTLALLLLIHAVGSSAVQASDQIPGAEQKRPIAIVGATVYPVDSEPISQGIVVFENGRITQVGRSVTLPSDCEVIQADGKHVYPSLIEAYSDIGLVEVNTVRGSVDRSEVGTFNPNVRAVAAFNPDSEIIPVNRANGILLSVTAPSGGTVSGRSSLMMMDGWTWEDMALRQDTAMHVNWPRSEEGREELQDLVDLASRYQQRREGKSEQQPLDLRLEAMTKVLDGTLPMVIDADSYDEIEAAAAFASQNGIRVIIMGGYDAPQCSDLLKELDIPVIVSGVYRNPRRRHEAYDHPYTLPARLHAAGVPFCISAGGRFGANGVRNLPFNAGTAAGYGLPEEIALRSITLSAAEILGVADRVGSLSVGKDATLIIADGNILETPTQVERAFVQGRSVDLDNKHRQLYRKYSTKYERLAE